MATYNKRCIYRTSRLVDDHKGRFEHTCSFWRRTNDPCIGESRCEHYCPKKEDEKMAEMNSNKATQTTKAARIVTLCGQKAMPFGTFCQHCKHMTMQYPYDQDKEELGDEEVAFCDFGEGGKLSRCFGCNCPIWADLDDAQPRECRE